jgi:hypothetical protein
LIFDTYFKLIILTRLTPIDVYLRNSVSYSFIVLSRVCGDYYIRRVLDWQLDLLGHTHSYTHSVYTLTASQFTIVLLSLLTITTDSHNWVTTPAEFLQGPGPPADPTGSHWLSTNSSAELSPETANLRLNWLAGWCPWLYSPWTDPKENTASDPLLLHDVITRTDHKENTHCCIGCCCVFIRCHSNGCQHMLYCLQHARHTIDIKFELGVALTGFVWLRIGISDRLLWTW